MQAGAQRLPGQGLRRGAIRLTETLFLGVRHGLQPGNSGGWYPEGHDISEESDLA